MVVRTETSHIVKIRPKGCDTVATLDKPTLAGLSFCAVPVAIFSASSQVETGRMARIPGELAWVLPVATDAAAFVATRIWLNEKYSPGVRKYAAFIVIMCVGLSVAGAALHVGLTMTHVDGQPAQPPGWLGFAVGAIPSLVLAMLIHLGALISAAPEKHGKASRTTSSPRKTGSPSAGTSEHVRPPTSAVPASSSTTSDLSTETGSELKPEPANASSVASAPEVGKGSTRDRMLAHLDAVNGDITGAELDRLFGTQNYGRGVLRAWKRHHPIASGE